MYFWSSVFFHLISIQMYWLNPKNSLPMQRHLVRELVPLPSTWEAPWERQWFSGLPSVAQRTMLQSEETRTMLLRIPSTAACRIFARWILNYEKQSTPLGTHSAALGSPPILSKKCTNVMLWFLRTRWKSSLHKFMCFIWSMTVGEKINSL